MSTRKPKKALILVQGITNKNYILDALVEYINLGRGRHEHRFYKITNKERGISWIGPHDLHGYDMIVSIDTEQFLTSWSLFGLWDRLGDYVLGNYGRIDKVRQAIVKEIERLRKEYGITCIDAVGHSYGSQALAGVETEFNVVVFAGSPITSKHWYVRRRTSLELGTVSPKFAAKDFYYLWNRQDRVCTSPLKLPGVKNREVGDGHKFFRVYGNTIDGYLSHIDDILSIKSKECLIDA